MIRVDKNATEVSLTLQDKTKKEGRGTEKEK